MNLIDHTNNVAINTNVSCNLIFQLNFRLPFKYMSYSLSYLVNSCTLHVCVGLVFRISVMSRRGVFSFITLM